MVASALLVVFFLFAKISCACKPETMVTMTLHVPRTMPGLFVHPTWGSAFSVKRFCFAFVVPLHTHTVLLACCVVEHTHVKAGYPQAQSDRTGRLPRRRGSAALPGKLPLTWFYFSVYTPVWPVRTKWVRPRPPGVSNRRIRNDTTRSRSLPTCGYVERWHAHIATTGGPHRYSLYLREYT